MIETREEPLTAEDRRIVRKEARRRASERTNRRWTNIFVMGVALGLIGAATGALLEEAGLIVKDDPIPFLYLLCVPFLAPLVFGAIPVHWKNRADVQQELEFLLGSAQPSMANVTMMRSTAVGVVLDAMDEPELPGTFVLEAGPEELAILYRNLLEENGAGCEPKEEIELRRTATGHVISVRSRGAVVPVAATVNLTEDEFLDLNNLVAFSGRLETLEASLAPFRKRFESEAE